MLPRLWYDSGGIDEKDVKWSELNKNFKCFKLGIGCQLYMH